MDKTQELNLSSTFWLSDHMDDDDASQSKVLSQEDVKDFITTEIKEKKKELKDYFEARQKWV